MQRGALIGCGFIAPRHLTAWSQIESVTIEALCDKDRGRAQAMADRFGIRRVFTSFDDLLGECRVDFVDVASGPETHLPLATRAVEAGLHVLLQKPFANTTAVADQIVELSERSGRMIAVNEMWKWMPAYQCVKRMLVDAELGEIRNVRFHKLCNLVLTAVDGGVPPFLSPGRQSRFRTMKQLILFEYGVHLLDVLRDWFGECTVAAAITSCISPYVIGEDSAFVELRFRGPIATLELDWSVPGPEVVDPIEQERLTILGTDGLLVVEGVRALTCTTMGSRTVRQIFEEDPRAGGFLASQTDFAKALDEGTFPASPVNDSVKTLHLLWECYSAADAHRRAHEIARGARHHE